MCYVVSLIVTNISLWWETLIIEKAVHVWGQGFYEKSLFLPLNFAIKQKSFLSKNKRTELIMQQHGQIN